MTQHLLSRLLFAAALAGAPLAAQTITVSSATPNSATQGTTNLSITIGGKGFKNGAVSHFFVSGTTDPGGVAVNSTVFTGSTTLVANITVSSTATISGFDIQVDNPDGHTGKGTDSFSVTAASGSASTKCTPGPLPAGVTQLATFNATTGTPAYTSGIGKTVRGVLTTVLGRPVIMAVTGGTGGVAEVFFLDPTTGAVLDGTFGQPHLTLPTPQASFNYMAIGDLNNDGVPDLAMGAGEFGVVWVFLGQGGGASTISFSPSILLTPNQANSGNNAALAIGNLGGAYNTLAVGTIPASVGKKLTPGMVALYRFNGSGFTNYATITDPQNTTSSFGWSVAIGDVTGDSIPDLLVGAFNSNRAWVFPSGGLTGSFFVSGATNDQLGLAVAAVNMSGASGGFSDLVALNTAASNQQSAFVFAGPVTGASTPALQFAPVSANSTVGSTLDFGDMDQDGLADLALGESLNTCSGSALVYLSSPSYHSYLIPGPLSKSNSVGFGSAAGVVAGTHIVLVGDRYWTGPSGVQSGQVYVYSVQ